ncbi:MAG: hypothetical protein NXI20_06710 [bacterium]|nr:hypothetical protein [bacterium]
MKKKLRDLGLDLLVVFIGVFAAFQLSDIKDSRKDRTTKLKYFESFKMELTNVNNDVLALKDSIDNIISYYEEGISRNEKPELIVRRNMFFMAKPHIVESAFDSDIFSNMHPGYLVSISRGSNLFYWIDQKLKNYDSRCKDLLYNSDVDSDYYYNKNGLKTQFKWYLDDLKELSVLLGSLNQSIEQGAIPGTERQIESMK